MVKQKRSWRIHVRVAGLLWIAAPAWAAPAHHHGQARLEAVLEGDVLTVLLTSPLDALVGFERAPRSEPERRALAAMSETLREGGKMVLLPRDAGCTLQGVKLDSPVLTGRPVEGGHADSTAEYRFSCSRAASLREMRLGFFASFPRLHKIELQFVGPGVQRAATLTPKNPRFGW